MPVPRFRLQPDRRSKFDQNRIALSRKRIAEESRLRHPISAIRHPIVVDLVVALPLL